MTDKAKRVVTKFNFDKLMQSGSVAHVALVDTAANAQEVLVMKQKDSEVMVELSMREFLRKFFDLWSEDAAVLAGILGYSMGEDETVPETYEEYIQGKVQAVTLLKGKEIPETMSKGLVDVIKSLQETVGDKLETPSVEEEVIETKKSSKEGETTMDEQELAVLQEELVELRKAKEEKDAIQAELDILKQAKEDQRKADMVDLVKGFTFITEDAQAGVVDALLASDQAEVFVTTLEKAREAILAVATEEKGHDNEAEVVVDTNKSKTIDAVQLALKARKESL